MHTSINCSGLSYWLAVGGNYDSKTVRIDPEEHTLVNSSDAIISKRILAMKSIDSQVYFLGYEGYGIYNLADNTLRLMPITFVVNILSHRRPRITNVVYERLLW